jgi:hypothetical protein
LRAAGKTVMEIAIAVKVPVYGGAGWS